MESEMMARVETREVHDFEARDVEVRMEVSKASMGSVRCCTSARTAKRISSAMLVNWYCDQTVVILYNYSHSRVQTALGPLLVQIAVQNLGLRQQRAQDWVSDLS